MKSSGRKPSLTSYDDIFSTEASRQQEQIQRLALSELHPFKDHPFRVLDDDRMMETVESVKEYGVLVPIIARPMADGGYEIVSGHRRKRACELAGMNEIPAIVRDLDDDEAVIIMVDSNLQRENILPSERAKAYQMKMEAIKRQGERVDLTSRQVGEKLLSIEQLAENSDDSARQIQRYIRLTYLVDELLEMVDENKIKMSPAVEISYLDEDCQRDLVDAIDDELCTPSHAQAIRMHKDFNEGTLTREKIYSVMKEEKGNQKPKISIQVEKINKYLPKNVKKEQTEEFICKALEHYSKYLQKKRDRECR